MSVQLFCTMSYAQQQVERNRKGEAVGITIGLRDIIPVTLGDNDGKTVEIPSVYAYYAGNDDNDNESISVASSDREARNLSPHFHLGSVVDEALEEGALEESAVLRHFLLAFFDTLMQLRTSKLGTMVEMFGIKSRHLQKELRQLHQDPRCPI